MRLVSAFTTLSLLLPMVAQAEEIRVSFLSGAAEVLKKDEHRQGEDPAPDDGAWKKLARGAALKEGDSLRTGEGSRLELSLPDRSRVRLGPKAKLTIAKAHFGADGERSVGLGLWVGRLWATVTRKLAGGSAFEVETKNAVAGVRGTSFTMIAQEDMSAVLRVYTGTVGVRKGQGLDFRNRQRTQVAGPERIDRKQWEEIIASAMKQVKISALGQIAPAEDFEPEGEELEWALWNQTRDGSKP